MPELSSLFGGTAGALTWDGAGNAAADFDSDAFAPLEVTTDSVHIDAGSMVLSSGSAALSTVGSAGYPAWLFDAASDERVVTSLLPRQWWDTVDVDLYWTNAGAGSGDVRWELMHKWTANAVTLSAAATQTPLTVTAPAQNVLKVTTIASGLAVTAGSILSMRIRREGGHVEDTLANDAGLVAVVVRRANP